MQSMKDERDANKSPKKNIGFYISLAICISAIAAAAWTTYGSVAEYTEFIDESSSEQSSDDVNVGTDVSGEEYENSAQSESESSIPEKQEQDSDDDNSEPESSVPEESEKPVFNDNIAEYSESAETDAEVSASKTASPIEKGEVFKAFSPKNPIESKTMGDWRTHNGVDISAGEGTPVRAIMSGKVLKIYNDPMLGNVIEIDHNNGYVAYYCGLTDTTIAKEGSIIKAGDTIGYIGIIPSESKDETHLHLEVKLNDEYIDPTILYN